MENKSLTDLGILNDSVIKIDITKGKQNHNKIYSKNYHK